jgi:hypothetical protein
MAMLCSLTVPDRDSVATLEILDAFPSGRGLRLLVRRDGVCSRIGVGDLPRTVRDAESGEPIADPLQYVRSRWARRICAVHGGWPLHQLIAGLLVEGFGTTTAADIALALGTWERFDQAIDQLCEATIPASREEFVLAHNARGRPVGLFESTPEALDHALDLYPEPLSSLLDACGPRAWRGLRAWGRSPRRSSDVALLLGTARPSPFGPADFEAFMNERFAAPGAD